MVSSYMPETLKEALDIRRSTGAAPYAGGTDLMVNAKEDASYVFVHKLKELRRVIDDGDYIRIGAAVTFTELIRHNLCPSLIRTAACQIAAPAIRNNATLGGNIANASPKADGALAAFALSASLVLTNYVDERIVPIADFYTGRGKTVIRKDEILTEILIPKTEYSHEYFYKVAPRAALAISRAGFSGVANISDGKITAIRTAFGAITDTILCRPDIDQTLLDCTITEAKALKESYLNEYKTAILPIKGRVSAEYRKNVCMNLLNDFLNELGI